MKVKKRTNPREAAQDKTIWYIPYTRSVSLKNAIPLTIISDDGHVMLLSNGMKRDRNALFCSHGRYFTSREEIYNEECYRWLGYQLSNNIEAQYCPAKHTQEASGMFSFSRYTPFPEWYNEEKQEDQSPDEEEYQAKCREWLVKAVNESNQVVSADHMLQAARLLGLDVSGFPERNKVIK
jgi:hypothetical protein